MHQLITLTHRIGSPPTDAKDLDNARTQATVGHEGGDGTPTLRAAAKVSALPPDAEEGLGNVLAEPTWRACIDIAADAAPPFTAERRIVHLHA